MSIIKEIRRDFKAVFQRDPAAKGVMDVLLNYSGFYAVLSHRISHRLQKKGLPLTARFFSQITKMLTGVEIHPAARIGPGLFIDHGVGVVIGETAETGEECLLYQGVTLGGTGKERGKRHPTLGDHVVVGAGAKVLGPINIGNYVKIGANSVVLEPAPDYSIVVGVPGKVVKKKFLRIMDGGPVEELDHVHLPDPVDKRFRELETHINNLERKIEKLEGKGERMKIFNSLTGKKEDFISIEPGKVNMYVCGVTVYDFCHVGHARSAVVFDIIRRYLIFKGYDVTFIKNFTDIDDKIIKRAAEKGVSWREVTQKYTDEYYRDMESLGVDKADIEPKATEHITEIIDLIKSLEEIGFAYAVDGDVFFEVSRFKEYGKLSKKDIKGLEAGARIDVNRRKRNPMDFTLWKKSKEGEPWWAAPWGEGRPGWHTECSAMSIKYLGESFDIHGGGADLLFPHHENELAQSECFTGKPFVKYWIHNGFITIDKEKMSKSLGNFFTIREILKDFDPEVLRIFLLSTHYRHPIEFSEDQLKQTETSIDRYYTTVLRVEDFLANSGDNVKESKEEKKLRENLDNFKNKFIEVMDDDFNTAMAMGNLFETIRELNRYLDTRPSGPDSRELVKKVMEQLKETGGVLNIFIKTPQQWYSSLKEKRKIPLSDREIDDLILKRHEARKLKQWAVADEIRNDLDSKGIILEDKTDGTRWKVKI